MLAHYSMDPELIQAFEEGRDLHILTGAGFARMEYEELKGLYESGDQKAKELRALGKTGNFALNYGMGPQKFQRYLVVNNGYFVEIGQAKEWIASYNDKYSVATKWKEGVKKFVRENGFVVTFGGRKRRLPNAFSQDRGLRSYAERQGVNTIIQGSVGDVMIEAMNYIQPVLRSLKGSILLQVHDELVSEVPTEFADLGRHLIEDLLTRFCNPRLRIPQKAEVHVGSDWGSAKG